MRRGLSRSTTAETPHKNPQETTTTTKRKFGFGGGVIQRLDFRAKQRVLLKLNFETIANPPTM